MNTKDSLLGEIQAKKIEATHWEKLCKGFDPIITEVETENAQLKKDATLAASQRMAKPEPIQEGNEERVAQLKAELHEAREERDPSLNEAEETIKHQP